AAHIRVAGGGQDAVAGIREPLPVIAGLGAILLDGETGQFGSVGSQFSNPANDGKGNHRLGAGGASVGGEGVAALAGNGTGVADALEVPVVAGVIGVELPVVAGGVVAAVAVEGAVEVGELGRRGVGDAVDEGIDRMAAGARVHAHRHRRVL